MGNTFLGYIKPQVSLPTEPTPINDVAFGFHFFGALITGVFSAYMLIEIMLNEKYKHITYQFEKSIIKMQNRYFVWAFWSLLYIFLYAVATLFLFSNVIFRWKYIEFWRPATLFIYGLYVGCFTAGNSFGMVAFLYRMEAMAPDVKAIWFFIFRIILYFFVVLVICLSFYGDYIYYVTKVIDGSLVVFMRFPGYYAVIWLLQAVVWIIGLVFLNWEFGRSLRRHGLMTNKLERAKAYRVGRESLMVLAYSLSVFIFLCIGCYDLERSCWYWNIELILLCCAIYYGFEFNDKSFYRMCHCCMLQYFKLLCILEDGDSDAMEARKYETQQDYDMAKYTPESTKDDALLSPSNASDAKVVSMNSSERKEENEESYINDNDDEKAEEEQRFKQNNNKNTSNNNNKQTNNYRTTGGSVELQTFNNAGHTTAGDGDDTKYDD